MILEAILCLLLLVYVLRSRQIPKGMPPGDLGWPVWGKFPPSNKFITEYLYEMRRIHGDVFTTQYGEYYAVIICDPRLARMIFSHPDTHGVLPTYFENVIHFHLSDVGIIGSQGEQMTSARRYIIRKLREVGMGRSFLDETVLNESAMLIRYFEKQDLTKPLNLDHGVDVAFANVFWNMITSERYEADDKEFYNIIQMFKDDVFVFGQHTFFDYFPTFMSVLPNVLKERIFASRRITQHKKIFAKKMKGIISAHIDSLDVHHPRDFVDHYLIDNMKDGKLSEHNQNDLTAIASDLFIGASGTVSFTFRWLLTYLAAFPEVQQKVADELEREISFDRMPSLLDKDRLPYLNATILDTLRLSSLAPVGPIPNHMVLKNVWIENYFIPKDTLVIPALDMMHKDPGLWSRPNELYPDHFLDNDGSLNEKVEAFMAFNSGRRECLAKSLSRMELFLFAASFLQKFQICAVDGNAIDITPDPTDKQLTMPRPHQFVIQKRCPKHS